MAESPAPRPLATMVSQAQNGELTVKFSGDVRVDAAEFAYIERDCEAFKIEIRNLQRLALNISERKAWGLGEDKPELTSAPIVVNWFRTKAAPLNTGDSANNVHDILQEHYDIVDDIQQAHRAIAEHYSEVDSQFASAFNEVKSHIDPSPIGQVQIQSGVTPPSPAIGSSK